MDVIEIILKDGRIFRALTQNKKQREKIGKIIYNKGNIIQSVKYICNGIHNIKDFEKIINDEK